MTSAVENTESVTELAALRQAILDDNETPDLENYEMLTAVETKIENAAFETDAEKLAGLMILFELNDAPRFADQFKAKLFSRIHECSSKATKRPIPIPGRRSNGELQHEIDETLKILGDTYPQKGSKAESSKPKKTTRKIRQ
jgi:hypothetical protein